MLTLLLLQVQTICFLDETLIVALLSHLCRSANRHTNNCSDLLVKEVCFAVLVCWNDLEGFSVVLCFLCCFSTMLKLLEICIYYWINNITAWCISLLQTPTPRIPVAFSRFKLATEMMADPITASICHHGKGMQVQHKSASKQQLISTDNCGKIIIARGRIICTKNYVPMQLTAITNTFLLGI